MGSLYYDLVGILEAAGCEVRVESVNEGWEKRSRSSGGFSSAPLGVWWHHSASSTTPENDLSYMINGSGDAPVGNLLIDRDGVVWPIAGGASNCAGKGGPWKFSRGTSPTDQGNTTGFQIEVANNGVGEPWSEATVNAFFRTSNALNAHVGNQPTDIVTHQAWAPTRKIDPATADAVSGDWQPHSCTSSGTWDVASIQAECQRRSDEGDEDMPTADEIAQKVWEHAVGNGVTGTDDDPAWVMVRAAHEEAATARADVEQLTQQLKDAGVLK